MGSLALVALMLLGACATGAPPGGRVMAYREERSTPLPSSETRAPETRSDEDNGALIFARLPTDFAPVRIGDTEFRTALVGLVLDMPLRVASSAPVRRGGRLAPGSGGSGGEAWQADMARSYGSYCERRGTPGDCITLFDDGPYLQEDDKRSLAMALAVGPALEGVDAELRAMLDPTRVLATVSITQLREAGERFGRVIGPNSVKILVLVGTAAVGETAALMSKAPKLPGYGQASRNIEVNAGLRMVDAATGAERVIVSVPEGTIRVVLPLGVVPMAAQGGGSGPPGMTGGKPLLNGHRTWRSHSGMTRALGSPGKGKRWHHIVEQHENNIKRFGPEAIHNTENVVPLEEGLHVEVSAFYSSKRRFITGTDKLTVREWIRTQSYEAQREFGLRAMENIGKGVWK